MKKILGVLFVVSLLLPTAKAFGRDTSGYHSYPFSGSFVNFERGMEDRLWSIELDQMKAVGENIIVISSSGHLANNNNSDSATICQPNDIDSLWYDSGTWPQAYEPAKHESQLGYYAADIDAFMYLAQQKQMQVYIGTLQTDGAWDSPRLRACNKAVIQELSNRYAHNGSLAGFYYAQEIWLNSVAWYYSTSPSVPALKGLVDDVREIALGKQVLASPYFKKDATIFSDNSQIDGMTAQQTGTALGMLLSGTGLKLVAPQDGIGAANGAPTLSDIKYYYAAMKQAADTNNATLWADTETFYNDGKGNQDKYPPADITRIVEQVNGERPYVSGMLHWMFGRDMSPSATYFPVAALGLYDAYKDYYADESAPPIQVPAPIASYSFSEQPASTYPDPQNTKLIDRTGGGYSGNGSWVGWWSPTGTTTQITLNFPANFDITKVKGVRFLARSEENSWIRLPQTVAVYSCTNGSNCQQFGYTPLAGELMSNALITKTFSVEWIKTIGTPVSGNQIKIDLSHYGWLMLAEVQVLVDAPNQ